MIKSSTKPPLLYSALVRLVILDLNIEFYVFTPVKYFPVISCPVPQLFWSFWILILLSYVVPSLSGVLSAEIEGSQCFTRITDDLLEENGAKIKPI